VLQNGGEALIQQVFHCYVVGVHHERLCLEVQVPMAHSLDEADEIPLICGQHGVLQGDGPAVEGNRAAVLMQNNTEPRARSIVVDDEGAIKVG
jgi:hypothetical protein